MGKLEDLNKALDDANSAVATWMKTITEIADQRDAACRAQAAAQRVREHSALRAAIGDKDAMAAAKEARAEYSDAAAILEDLAIAAPKADQQLAASKKTVELAQHALARHQAEGLMVECLASAGRIDAIIADLAAEIAAHDKLTRAILAVPSIVPANLHGMTSALVEQVIGDQRLREALPPGFIRRFFPSAPVDDRRCAMLAASELQVLAPLSATGLTDKADPQKAAA